MMMKMKKKLFSRQHHGDGIKDIVESSKSIINVDSIQKTLLKITSPKKLLP